jgi:hypothetical protein
MTRHESTERVIAVFLETQAKGPTFVAWSTLVELTGVPLATCRRIIADADGHDFLLARDDSTGCMTAQTAAESEDLTVHLKRDIANLQKYIDTWKGDAPQRTS